MTLNVKHLSDEELYAYLSQDKQKAIVAFNEIYERYSSKIYTYCHKVLDNSEVADDIFQDTFTKFFEGAVNNAESTNLAAYLIKIARNLCLNEKSKKHNQNVPLNDFQFPVYDKSYENKEINELLETALEALPENYKEALIMKEFMDLSYKEIAEALNVSLSVVRTRIYRGKTRLREIMAPYIKDLTGN